MGTLTRLHVVIFEAHLYNGPGTANLAPFYGYAQPGILGAPATGTNEQVGAVVLLQAVVDGFYFAGNIGVFARLIAFGFDVHHIFNLRNGAVAQGVFAEQEGVFRILYLD